MNAYDKLKRRANRITSNSLRNLQHTENRIKIINFYKRYATLLDEIQNDYPRLLEKDIHTIAVNRLRHQDEKYKIFVRSNMKSKKKEYTDQFIDVLDRVLLNYPFLIDEIINQVQKKNRRNEIVINDLNKLYLFSETKSYSVLVKDVLFYAFDFIN